MSIKDLPLISVIIPAYNEEDYIDKCLKSIEKQDINKQLFEVIVVNNASTDKTLKAAGKYPFKIINEPKRGVTVARQAGVNIAKGKIIVSADADTIYPKNWLSRIKYDFEKNPNSIALVGWIYFVNAPAITDITMGFTQEINNFLYKTTGKFPLVFAANFAFKHSALDKIGGYPEYLPELGDQQYLLNKFFKMGKVIVDHKLYCHTSSRRHNSLPRNYLLDNGWFRLIGYPVNKLFKREIIGPAPAIRKVNDKSIF